MRGDRILELIGLCVAVVVQKIISSNYDLNLTWFNVQRVARTN